jgi:hypothetical protein
MGVCPSKRLQNRYQQHARRRGAKARAISTEVGMFLSKHAPGMKNKKGDYKRYDQKNEAMVDERGSLYHFPTLAVCRDAFDKKMQQTTVWPEGGWVTEPPPDVPDLPF